MRLTLGEIASCLDVTRINTHVPVTGVVIDSRQCRPGDLFVCIPGEHVDGHDYASVAMSNGASAILASKASAVQGMPAFIVPDTVAALGKLASYWRDRTSAKVLCVTGTAGKTTLKETLASIFSLHGNVAKSEKNHNNQIGLPCSMLAANGDEDFWIMEAGISHEGDMDELGAIARPDLAIILNVGAGHEAGLGKNGVAWHKSRLLAYVRSQGLALASADYPELLEQFKSYHLKPILFSTRKNADAPYRITGMDAGVGVYEMDLDGQRLEVSTPFLGSYGAETSIAAAAAACLCGVPRNFIVEGLGRLALPDNRFNKKTLGHWHIFDDTYNANPLSMLRMLEAAQSFAASRNFPLLAVLGEMGELGEHSANYHENLGRQLGRMPIPAVFWKGGHGDDLARGMAETSKGKKFFACPTEEDFTGSMRDFLDKNPQFAAGGVIIFKGSRANKLENFVSAFMAGRDMEKNCVL